MRRFLGQEWAEEGDDLSGVCSDEDFAVPRRFCHQSMENLAVSLRVQAPAAGW
jgi:hypothetical protein